MPRGVYDRSKSKAKKTTAPKSSKKVVKKTAKKGGK